MQSGSDYERQEQNAVKFEEKARGRGGSHT